MQKNNFPEFKLQKKSNALVSEKPFDSAQGDEKIILVKPQTFMNESGKAIKEIIKDKPVENTPLKLSTRKRCRSSKGMDYDEKHCDNDTDEDYIPW